MKFKKERIADEDDGTTYIDASYTVNKQGIIVSFKIPFEFDEISNVVDLSNLFMETVKEQYIDMIDGYGLYSKSDSPYIICLDGEPFLIICYVGKNTPQLKSELQSLKIKEVNY